MLNHEKLNIGVVGLGRFVEIGHMPTYVDSRYAPYINVAAICDINEERTREWQQKYNIPNGYTNHKAMLEKEQLDAVVVVTPDHLHTGITCDALESGCDVLVEKPLAMDIVECHRIITTARKAERRVITDFHKREDPAHQEARYRIVDEKRYGQVQFGYVWMQDTIDVPAPGFFRSDLVEKSSPVWFLGVHFFDLLRFLTDLQPVEIRATGYKQVLVKQKVNTFDAIKSDILFSNGASISFFLSWNIPVGAPNATQQGVYLQFENGELEIDTRDRGMYEISNQGYRTVNPMFTRRSPHGMAGYGHESIGEALLQFLELKQNGRKTYQDQLKADPSDINGFYSTLMGQATHLSLERGKKSADGGVFIGANIDLNEYIKERLDKDARDYLIKADM